MKPLRNSIHKFLKSAEVTFFEGLYRDYFTRTLFFAQQYLPDPEEAREIAQETFVTLWEKRTEIRPDLSVQAFILTIAKHKCLNVLRKKIAEQKYSDNLTARETMANYSALSDETFDTVQMQELEQLIGQALSELPEKTRIIYKMSRDQEMTYEEKYWFYISFISYSACCRWRHGRRKANLDISRTCGHHWARPNFSKSCVQSLH